MAQYKHAGRNAQRLVAAIAGRPLPVYFGLHPELAAKGLGGILDIDERGEQYIGVRDDLSASEKLRLLVHEACHARAGHAPTPRTLDPAARFEAISRSMDGEQFYTPAEKLLEAAVETPEEIFSRVAVGLFEEGDSLEDVAGRMADRLEERPDLTDLAFKARPFKSIGAFGKV